MRTRPTTYTITLGELSEIPGTPYAYWAPKRLRKLFHDYPPLDRDVAGKPNQMKIADVKVGLQTSDDLRFTRYWWEVPANQIAANRDETTRGKKWVPYSHSISLWYFWGDVPLVVDWENDGREMRNYPNAKVQNESYYFRPGLAWSTRTQRSQRKLLDSIGRIPLRMLPAQCIFSHVSNAVFPPMQGHFRVLAFLISRPQFWIFKTVVTDRATTSSLAILPVPPKISEAAALGEQAREAHDLLRDWATGDETSPVFIEPWIVQILRGLRRDGDIQATRPVTGHPLAKDFCWSDWDSSRVIRAMGMQRLEMSDQLSLRGLAGDCVRREAAVRERIKEIERRIDGGVYELYGFSDEDRVLVEAELGSPPDLEGEEEAELSEDPELEGTAASEGVVPAEEHIRRFVHYLAHQVLRDDPDGIVPLEDTYTVDGRFERGMAYRVTEKLNGHVAQRITETDERDLRDALGMSLEDWLETEFFPYHMSLFRLRPIVWPITSSSRGRPAFACFVHWHKLDADTLRKVREVYLRPALEGARRRLDQLEQRVAELRTGNAPVRALREGERAWRQAGELHDELRGLDEGILRLIRPHQLQVQSRSAWVQQKVNEITAQGYRPNRDYGVRVNIEPLKQAGILPADTQRVRG